MKNTVQNKSLEHYYAVIMAGGGGTRLWPLSRHDHPKQMLALSGNRTLFQLSIERLKGLFPLERILIVTSKDQAKSYLKQVPGLSASNFLLEPEPKGTAAVIAWVARILIGRDPESVMAVLTADHVISNEQVFKDILISAFHLSQTGCLVTLGITPSFAHTGYGYIQYGGMIGIYYKYQAYSVKKFKEKPDEKKARQFIKSGDHAWNSGMFVWKTQSILSEFQKWMPDLYNKIIQFCSAHGSKEKPIRDKIWASIHPQTIDYGIMEKAKNIAMIKTSDLGWNDVGSWESLFEFFPPDENGNILLKGNMELLETENSILNTYNPEKLITGIGVKNMIIIDTEDALLVCSRKDAQKVKDLVNFLKQKKQSRYL